MQKKLIITKDGSPSFEVAALKETYHSRHGAQTESSHVYIDCGLRHWMKTNKKIHCRVFELGYGTGLNALLAFELTKKEQVSLEYTTVENDPIDGQELQALAAAYSSRNLERQDALLQLHQLPWAEKKIFSAAFQFEKFKVDYFDYPAANKFDVLFYDAFGAHAQSDLWTAQALQKAYTLLAEGGVWVSYCAKGSVRRALEELGMTVERLAGPPGKREMLRATRVD